MMKTEQSFSGYSTESSFRRILRRSLFLPLLFPITFLSLTGWQFHRLSQASKAMLVSEKQLTQIMSIQNAFLKMQTSVRGYLLTGNSDFLKLFNETAPQIESVFEDLETITQLEPDEIEIIKHLKKFFQRWMAEAGTFIDFRKTHPTGLPPNYGQMKQGGLAAGAQLLISKLIEEETVEANNQTAAYTTQRDVFLSILFGGTLIITVVALLLNRLQLTHLSNLYKRSESNFAELTNLIPQLVWVANSKGCFEWLNDNWARFTGQPIEKLLGSSWNFGNSTFKLNGSPVEVQFPIRRFDGVSRWFLVRAVPIRDHQNKIIYWFGTNTDIDEEHKRRYENISVASHEIKTPLTALTLQIQMLMKKLHNEEPQSTPELLTQLDFCNQQSSRMTMLLNQLLDLTQIQRDEIQLNRSPSDLVALTRQILETFHPEATKRKTPLLLVADGPLIGNVDSSRLSQVISNLLSNALKYAPGQPITIKVEKNGNHGGRLIVQDKGIGIPLEMQRRIFNRFERGDPSTNVSGLGLGLYISRQIVVAHGGNITVESELSKGATFTVNLPLGIDKTDDA